LLPDLEEDVLDLGSGAGIPGLPIKIGSPHLRITIVESRRRPALFVSAAIRELGLSDVELINARAEAILSDFQGRFGAVLMRCAGKPSKLFDLALRLVKPRGAVIAAGPPTLGAPQIGLGCCVILSGIRPGTTRNFVTARRV